MILKKVDLLKDLHYQIVKVLDHILEVFEATNKLFAKNPLFAKSKSRKNKIFDPRSQYFDNGGISKLEGDLISKVIMNRNRGVDFVDRAYALGDNPGTPMFNLPDDEQFWSKHVTQDGMG